MGEEKWKLMFLAGPGPTARAYILDDEVYGGQVLVVLGDDDQGSATGVALSGHFLNLAPNRHSAVVVAEPYNHNEDALKDRVRHLNGNRIHYALPFLRGHAAQ